MFRRNRWFILIPTLLLIPLLVGMVPMKLANKMARGIWAMLTRGESYRGPVLIGA